MSNLTLHTSDATPQKISIIAGVIRRVGNGWIVLNDAGHCPIGINPIITEPTSSSIKVKFDKTYSKVLSCNISGDDTYAQRGYIFGGSCGLDKVTIFHSKAGTPSLNTDLNIAGSNIWIQIMMYD